MADPDDLPRAPREPDRRFCVAPMMACTDRHDRYFLRLKHVAMTLGGANEQLAILGQRLADEARAGVAPSEILQ